MHEPSKWHIFRWARKTDLMHAAVDLLPTSMPYCTCVLCLAMLFSAHVFTRSRFHVLSSMAIPLIKVRSTPTHIAEHPLHVWRLVFFLSNTVPKESVGFVVPMVIAALPTQIQTHTTRTCTACEIDSLSVRGKRKICLRCFVCELCPLSVTHVASNARATFWISREVCYGARRKLLIATA